jgi:hypothetical protein
MVIDYTTTDRCARSIRVLEMRVNRASRSGQAKLVAHESGRRSVSAMPRVLDDTELDGAGIGVDRDELVVLGEER